MRIGWVEGDAKELSALARRLPFSYQIWTFPSGRERLVIFGINELVAGELSAAGNEVQLGELVEEGCGKKSG